MADPNASQDFFIVGLRNARAMENEALSIMQPQLRRLEHYPEVSALLDRHIRETEGQIERLNQILDKLGESSSSVKDTMASLGGSMAAIGHTVANDEIIKNSLANFAFENYEIAAYTALLTAAEISGASFATPLLEQNLQEERQMVKSLEDSLPMVVRQYVRLSASGERADI